MAQTPQEICTKIATPPATTKTTMARRPTRDPYARPAIQTLERLHSELGGRILENRQEASNLAEQMRHVEAVIKMLDPSCSLRAISVKRRATGNMKISDMIPFIRMRYEVIAWLLLKLRRTGPNVPPDISKPN